MKDPRRQELLEHFLRGLSGQAPASLQQPKGHMAVVTRIANGYLLTPKSGDPDACIAVRSLKELCEALFTALHPEAHYKLRVTIEIGGADVKEEKGADGPGGGGVGH